MTQRHIMIDLETLGKGPRAAIAAIGAVEFDPYGQGLGRELYHRVNIESSVAAGMVIEPATVIWWLQQSDAARAEIASEMNVSLMLALMDLSQLICGPNLGEKDTIVWANGSSFDFPILAFAYRACCLDQPWEYFNERDWRTVRKIGPQVELERTGPRHHALEDARHQALHLQLVMARLHQMDLQEAA